MSVAVKNLDRALSISFRPQTFSELVGQRRIVDLIRAHLKSGRSVPAWMFVGETGAGKTTLARILAVALQCTHSDSFGDPCEGCRANRDVFDIIEVNASDVSGVNEIGQVVSGYNYVPRSPSRKRVYILDEAQKLSDAAQNSLLKPFEDAPKSTVWIICTTEPRKILRTLRSRCLTYTIPGLGIADVEKLAGSALLAIGSDKSPGPLSEALHERGVTSPRMIVMAVEKYAAGAKPGTAAQVGMEASIDTMSICRAVVKGDWDWARKELSSASAEDARAIRGAVAGYLKSVLLASPAGKKAAVASDALIMLGRMPFEDALQLPWTAAVVYEIARKFRKV